MATQISIPSITQVAEAADDALAVLEGGTHSTRGTIAPADSVEGLSTTLQAQVDGIAEQYGTAVDATTFQNISNGTPGSTLSGFAGPIGPQDAFDAVRLRLWPVDSGALPTQVRVLITEDDKDGAVLGDSGVVAVSGLTAQATNHVTLDLGVEVDTAADLYLIVKADASIGRAIASDSLPTPTYGQAGYYNDGDPSVTTGWLAAGTHEAVYCQVVPYEGYQLLSGVRDRLATQLNVGEMRPEDDRYRMAGLTPIRAAIARLQAASPSGVASLAVCGDSWAESGGPVSQLVDVLEGAGLPNVGPGLVFFARTGNGASSTSTTPTGWTVTVDAGWSALDVDQGDTAWGINGLTMESSASGETITLDPGDETWRTCRIDFLARSGGGTFRYRVNGGTWQTVNADNAGAQAHDSVTVDNGGDQAYAIEIEALAAGVRILDADVRKDGAGFVVHRAGNGGAKAEHYAALDATIFAAHMNAVGAHATVWFLGTNDQASRTATEFADDLETVLALVASCTAPTEESGYTVAPAALYVSPAENISSRSTLISEYVTEVRARINAGTWDAAAAFFDFHQHASDRTANRASGIFAGGDLYHMQTGGRVLAARLVWDALRL